jgi:phage gpG-like protein
MPRFLTPADLATYLGSLQVEATMTAALDTAAAKLAGDVRERLDSSPGGDHSEPWRQTGALHDSIAHQAEGLTAMVGSNDAAAMYQELGTRAMPPRPFLVPAAASLASGLADDIGAAVAGLLKPF